MDPTLGALERWLKVVRVGLADADPTGAIRRTGLLLNARKLGRQVKESTLQNGLKESDIVNEIGNPSGTLFLLGSGASVEDMIKSDWEHIAQHQSIGLNRWAIHSFVPDYFSFERVLGHSATAELIAKGLNRPEVIAKQPLILLPSDYFGNLDGHRISFPAELHSRLRVYSKLSLGTRRTDRLDQAFCDFIYLWRRNAFPHSTIPSISASIDRLSFLGLMAGFRTIVLVGVDLKNVDYFFQRNPSHAARLGTLTVNTGQKGTVHKTDDPHRRPITISQSIKSLRVIGSRYFGAEFFVGSPDSALASFLPVYDWPRGPGLGSGGSCS